MVGVQICLDLKGLMKSSPHFQWLWLFCFTHCSRTLEHVFSLAPPCLLLKFQLSCNKLWVCWLGVHWWPHLWLSELCAFSLLQPGPTSSPAQSAHWPLQAGPACCHIWSRCFLPWSVPTPGLKVTMFSSKFWLEYSWCMHFEPLTHLWVFAGQHFRNTLQCNPAVCLHHLLLQDLN